MHRLAPVSVALASAALFPRTIAAQQPSATIRAVALRSAVGATFDRLDIDGGTSTNDTVLLLASGASGVTPTM